MGERLVINVQNEGKVVVNAYYHWSGYTDSAIDLTTTVLNGLEKHADIENVTLRAVRALAETGAGFNDLAIDGARDVLNGVDNIPVCNDRNCGLMEVSEDGIDENEDAAEESVYIDVTNKTVNFGAYGEPDAENIESMSRTLLHMDFDDAVKNMNDIRENIESSNADMISEDSFCEKVYDLCIAVSPEWDGDICEIPFDEWNKFSEFIESTSYWRCNGSFLSKIG